MRKNNMILNSNIISLICKYSSTQILINLLDNEYLRIIISRVRYKKIKYIHEFGNSKLKYFNCDTLILYKCNLQLFSHHTFANLTKVKLKRCLGVTELSVTKLKHVTHLDMRETNITGEALVQFTNLVSLNISYCWKIKDNNLNLLTKLTELNLSFCWQIGDDGLINLTNLTRLILNGNDNISSGGINKLPNLRYVALRNMNFDLEFLNSLRHANSRLLN